MPIPPEPPAQGMDVDNEYFVNLFQEIPEAIVLSDNVGCIAKVNREFTRLFGYSEAEALGRFIDDLVAPEELREEATTITEAVAHGQKFALEAVRKRKDGSLVNVSLLGVPIVTSRRQVAVFGIYRDISARVKAERALVDSRRQLEEANSMLERISNHDGLTAIPNRRSFEHFYELEWRRACRERKWISLVMIDVDFFKSYNDHYGHVEGDECLKRVAQALAGAAHRPSDFLARYGGEEFVLLLPASDANAARAVAERCRQAIFKAQIAHAVSTVGQLLTVSIGAGTTVPSEHGDPVRFLDEVDRRLYRAKHLGRNRLVDTAA